MPIAKPDGQNMTRSFDSAPLNREGDPKSFFASSQRSDNLNFRTEDQKNWILQQTASRDLLCSWRF